MSRVVSTTALARRSVLLFLGSVSVAAAQELVELTIDGLATVMENTHADYTATALFDDGREFDVTLFCDWSVDPDTYASIDGFGRLRTDEVSKDQEVIVSASFIWEEVNFEDTMDVTIFDVPADTGPDPWPMWQRTASRLGRTATIGPQTPTFAWKVRVDPSNDFVILEGSPVMDAQGRVFVMHFAGLSAVDSVRKEVVWDFLEPWAAEGGIALWEGKVTYGTTDMGGQGGKTFWCVDAETGTELWHEVAGGILVEAPVVDAQGIVYFVDSTGVVRARKVEDGSEVWTTDLHDSVFASPSLDGLGNLFSGKDPQSVGLTSDTGDLLWNFATGAEVRGVLPVEDGRVYVGSRDRNLYCVNALTGEEIWRFPSLNSHRGGAAIGHDGTIYTGVVYRVFALTRDGEELWRYDNAGEVISNPPIVGGDGTIYFCTQTSPNFGTVRALRPDGNELWTYTMPHQVSASPMLAPDGTLYVLCRDKYLYAFRDPVGDLDFDGDIDLDDFAKFEECLTGPRLWGEAAKTTPGCELLDFDSDWDVDWTDFALFQLAFTGSP